jgi:hypothetical protein
MNGPFCGCATKSSRTFILDGRDSFDIYIGLRRRLQNFNFPLN